MNKLVQLLLALVLHAASAAVGAQTIDITPVDAGRPRFILFESVNNFTGEQNDAHVRGDLACYTDYARGAGAPDGGGTLRFYDFTTQVDRPIIAGALGDVDTLCSTNGTKIAFSRTTTDRTAIIVYDTVNDTQTEIDPQPGSLRFQTAMGGSRVAFVELVASRLSDVVVHDYSKNLTANLTFGIGGANGHPAAAGDGNTVTWERYDAGAEHSGVYAAHWKTPTSCTHLPCAGSWELVTVRDLPGEYARNPGTDGTWFVYQIQAVNAPNIKVYFKPVDGDDIERRLDIPGLQRDPSIDQGVIGLEISPDGFSPTDLYVYVIATNRLYRITSDPLVDQSLNSVTALPNGDVRVVWSANDEPGGFNNIYAATFTPDSVLAIDDASVAEGNSGTSALTFTVSLLPPSNQTVTVDFATRDSTATVLDGDYMPTKGTLTFAPGETSKTITVPVNGDTKVEPDETFTVVMYNATNAVVALNKGVATGTIVDDDASAVGDTFAPTTTASASPAPNVNGWYHDNVTVTLTAADNAGGSGVREIHYALGAFPFVVNGASTSVSIVAEGASSLDYFAVDNAGNAETSKTLVVRIDRLAPTIAVPSPISVPATSRAGATVAYAVTASDAGSGLSSPVACSPASASVFPVGTTTVNCTASDVAGNGGFASFAVTVKGAAAQTSELVMAVNGLGLAPGKANSFVVKLRDALDSINTGNFAGACTKLGDFISEVRAQSGPQPGKALTPAQAQVLITAAQTIATAIGCP